MNMFTKKRHPWVEKAKAKGATISLSEGGGLEDFSADNFFQLIVKAGFLHSQIFSFTKNFEGQIIFY